jgi:hypothetical protein
MRLFEIDIICNREGSEIRLNLNTGAKVAKDNPAACACAIPFTRAVEEIADRSYGDGSRRKEDNVVKQTIDRILMTYAAAWPKP